MLYGTRLRSRPALLPRVSGVAWEFVTRREALDRRGEAPRGDSDLRALVVRRGRQRQSHRAPPAAGSRWPTTATTSAGVIPAQGGPPITCTQQPGLADCPVGAAGSEGIPPRGLGRSSPARPPCCHVPKDASWFDSVTRPRGRVRATCGGVWFRRVGVVAVRWRVGFGTSRRRWSSRCFGRWRVHVRC